jgi:hypothetical protein
LAKLWPSLPDFYWRNVPKGTKYTISPQNVQNGYKIYQLAAKY